MSSEKFVASLLSPLRRRLLAGLVASWLAFPAFGANGGTEKPLPVVATFSILGDMVKEIGGERVSVTTIVGVNSDAHRFDPTPQDAKALLDAKALVLNGLDFEAWLPRLAQASGFSGVQILASKGVSVRTLNAGDDHAHHDSHTHAQDSEKQGAAAHAHQKDVDPHAWQDLKNGMIYARNIAHGLATADSRNASYYEGRAERYIARMKALDNEIRASFAAIPPERRRVITSHDAFGYFGAAYGIEFIPLAGLSNQAEPSAQDVARIITAARETHVSGVFIENMTSPLLAKQIAKETGAIMGGTLYADALGPPDQPASTYLGMFSWNAGRLLYVLRPKKG